MRYLLLFLLIFEFNFRISAQETLVTGLEDACESDINRNVTPGAIVLSSNFINPPKSVDLSKYLPAIGDQGTQGSCTAFSVAEALTILRNQHDSKTFNIRILQDLNTFCSPAFIFNIGKSKYPFPRSENCEDGISFIDAFIVARDYGIVTWPFIKYNPNGTAGCESKNFPDYKALKEGQKNKIVTFQRPDLDLNLFKCLLADNPGYPICIAVNIDKEYKKASNKESGSAIWAKKGISIAGQVNNRHAMLIVGYNDSIQCFKVLDSRGIEKGDNGFLWLSYDLLASRVIYDAYVCSFDGSLLKSQKAINSGSADLYLNIGSTKSTWLKQGYFRTFNGFRISCNEIDLLNKRVTFRIVDAYTKKVLVANITLTLYQQKYFTLKGKTFSLSLKSFERKGYGIFKKAIVFDISVSNEKIGEQFEPFIKYGNLKEDFERLFYGFISKTKDEMQNTEYIGQLINFSVGDIVSSNSNLLHTLPDNNIDSLVQEIKPFTFINNDSGIGNIKRDLDFHLNYFLNDTGNNVDPALRNFLEQNYHLKVTSISWQMDNLNLPAFSEYLLHHDNDSIDNNLENGQIIKSITNLYNMEGTLEITDPPDELLKKKLASGINIRLAFGMSRKQSFVRLTMDDKNNIKLETFGKIPIFAETTEAFTLPPKRFSSRKGKKS